jgi:hypothetical protein
MIVSELWRMRSRSVGMIEQKVVLKFSPILVQDKILISESIALNGFCWLDLLRIPQLINSLPHAQLAQKNSQLPQPDYHRKTVKSPSPNTP